MSLAAGKDVYLDHNANWPMTRCALDALVEAARSGGTNPSSGHRRAGTARALLEGARKRIAGLIGARPSEIVFTSGGTESNNLAIAGLFGARRANRVLVAATEHHSVLECAQALKARGAEVVVIPVDGSGRVSHERLSASLDGDVALVAVMLANNETGVLQDIPAIAALCNTRDVPLHCDAVQAVGKVAVDVSRLGASTVSLTAHKLGGPIGIGALMVRKGVDVAPMSHGGGQERGLRPGTQAFVLAHSMAAALADAVERLPEMNERVRALRNGLESRLRQARPDIVVHGEGVDRLPNTSLFTLPGADAAELMLELDELGVRVGTGAACGTGERTPSHVLMAMGRTPQEAHGTLRVSLSTRTSEEQVRRATNALVGLLSTPSF